MPWQAKDSSRFTRKANTPKKKRQWATLADRLLASGKSEGDSIRIANGVIKKRGSK